MYYKAIKGKHPNGQPTRVERINTMKYTKKAARETIEVYAHRTSWFDESMTQEDMYRILRYRMEFGESESRVIIASLVMAGAKFRTEEKR